MCFPIFLIIKFQVTGCDCPKVLYVGFPSLQILGVPKSTNTGYFSLLQLRMSCLRVLVSFWLRQVDQLKLNCILYDAAVLFIVLLEPVVTVFLVSLTKGAVAHQLHIKILVSLLNENTVLLRIIGRKILNAYRYVKSLIF